MTTTKETCPKCGAELKKESHIFAIAIFVCGSKLEADFTQSDRCRITELEKEKADGAELIKTASEVISKVRELEKEVERLREVLTESVTVMNGCKGLLFKSSEFMNRLYACVDRASALLEKKG
jgi:predicted  nucleic acid-binding Zn ribbon protein